MDGVSPLNGDKFREECGVFGVAGREQAAPLIALGLHALQHRGQEAVGVVTHDGAEFYSHRATGLVSDSLNRPRVIGGLPGHAGIGHLRYATTGASMLRNVQPLFATFEFGGLAVAHNGNLTNADLLRRNLVRQGAIFQSTSDTEVLIHLIARSVHDRVSDRLVDALNGVEGAFALVALTSKKLIGLRDPFGFRPLALGKIGDAWVLASESCAFDVIDAEFVREVEPGEMIVIEDGELRSAKPFAAKPKRFCIFEHVYFARPDSRVEGRSVYEARKGIGVELAREQPIDADLVTPIPDSGVPAAIGYAQEAGLPFEFGIIRNHYVGRTFIEPKQEIRNLGVKLKHSANRAVLAGKRVVLVDDSLVRGTTSKKIVQMVRDAGAIEAHLRIASPPTKHGCYYGVDTPESEHLLAANMPIDDIAREIGADSLAYVSIEGLYRAVGAPDRPRAERGFCDACFTGDYPTRLADRDARALGHS